MAYQLPHRESINSRWLTATLISIYMIIAALVILYSFDEATSGDGNPNSEISRKDFSKHNYNDRYQLTGSK